MQCAIADDAAEHWLQRSLLPQESEQDDLSISNINAEKCLHFWMDYV